MKATEITRLLNEAKEKNEKLRFFKATSKRCNWHDSTGEETFDVMIHFDGKEITLNFSQDRKILIPPLVYKLKKDADPSAVFTDLKKKAKEGGLAAIGAKSNTDFGKDWKQGK
jgi:hypothetical protein